MMDEATLLSGLKSKEEGAFKALFKELYTQTCFFANKIVENEKQAEDISMDAFTLLYAKQDFKYESFKQVKQYLFTIVYNAAVDHLKKIRLHKKHEPELYYLSREPELSLAEIAEIARYKTEMVTQLHQEIENLPDKCREIVKMVYLDKVPRDEVASRLGISINTVNAQCRVGIQKLRTVFSEKDLLILFLLIELYYK